MSLQEVAASKPTLLRKLHWILLSFCPSSLLLGVTTYITTDLASIPLFWVIPLAMYLLTFILTFARKPLWVDHCMKAQIVLVPLTAIAIVFQVKAMLLVLLLHLLTFFAITMGCHGTLARLKPDPRHLTEYFLWISFGGMLGGIFNALAAPNLFNGPYEYSLVFILSLLLRPQRIADTTRERILDYAIPLGFMAFATLIIYGFNPVAADKNTMSLAILNILLPLLMSIPLVFVAFKTHKRPLRFALVMVALFIAVPVGNIISSDKTADVSMVFAERNFFGVNRLFKSISTESIVLMHGTTIHGIQSLDAGKKLQLISYYDIMPSVYQHLSPKLYSHPMAVLGLGAGTLACLGHKDQTVDFFEIDPAIAAIASNPDYFSYLSDCPPKSNIILGDGRLEIAKTEEGRYGFIVVDTFSSDSIPVHILTREALAVYISKLAKGGIMAFNISNRHLNLAPVMANLAKDAGFIALTKENLTTAKTPLLSSSRWVLMARTLDDFRGLQKDDTNWKLLDDTENFAIWTDNYSNIFQTLF
jgi:spermidine synthase